MTSYGPAMERCEALSALPTAYRVALELRAEGAEEALIAHAAGVPVDALAALLEVGERKLAGLLGAADSEVGN
jgi:hypothetical protein